MNLNLNQVPEPHQSAMTQRLSTSKFHARLMRPAQVEHGAPWAFVVLPKEVSDTLARRGRTSVAGALNGSPFQATLEPDGRLSHWLRLEQDLLDAAGAAAGDEATLEIRPLEEEPDPEVPPDLQSALDGAPDALRTWKETTTIARVDWIHWVVSAKQAKTRAKRIRDACDMLASGKKRVCCFDTSGYYSKALQAPAPAIEP